MNSSETSALEGSGFPPDEAFQRLLLRSSLSASDRAAPAFRIRQFCRTAREFFQVDGAYFWQFAPPDELVAAEADGLMAELFGGTRLRISDNTVLHEAIQERKTVYLNHLPARFKLASQLNARALMAAPLVVGNKVVGAAAFLHMSDPEFFNDDLAAKATILTGQLGSSLEATGSISDSFAFLQRQQALAKIPHVPEGLPDAAAVVEGMAERLRLLLGTRLVCILQRHRNNFSLQAVAAETPQLAAAVRSHHDHRGMQFAADLAMRAISAGEPITVSIDSSSQNFGDMVPPGMLIAAPFRTAQSQGAVLVYPRRDKSFTEADKELVATITGFGAVALAHAELYETTNTQAQQLQNVLDIVSELNAIGRPEPFMQRFAVCAAKFLGFNRSCVGMLEEGEFHIHWKTEQGKSVPMDLKLQPQGAISRALLGNEVFWTDDLTKNPSPDSQRAPDWRQVLTVPLLGNDGSVLGMFGVLDRLDGAGISQEDIRRAKLLASHVGTTLEKFRLFTRMDQANRHWIEIFDAISDFIVVHDDTSKVLRINRSLADFIGVAPAALIGVEMSALFGAENPAMLRTCPFCRDGENNGEYVQPILERSYLISSSQVQGAHSDRPQTIHVLKDITDSREVERRYRELFGNLQEGLFFSTPGGHFVEVNDALVHILGYASREELLQADISTQIYFSPERRHAFSEQMQKHGIVKNYEETLRRKDGAPVYVLINGFAVRDNQGQITQYRGLILDISGLKSFQTELQRERDFSGKILNNTQSLILVVDTAGLISYGNRRWFDLGYEQRHLLGLPLLDLVSPSRRDQLNDALAVTLEGRQVDNLDLQILRGDGSIGQFSVNLSPMRDEPGNVTSVVVVMTDVTDAATLQAKLMHAEKMAAVGQLVSGVAHEVNNPLTAILGFADLLMENTEVSEDIRRDLRVILQEAQRTKQIVQNLLSFARQMPPQRIPVQLNSILRRTVQLRAYDFNSHGVEIIEQFDESLPEVIGDSQQLQQVFLNIMNNAYDAVRESGRPARIEIMTARRGTLVEVWFRDNGYGISHPDRIFDPFFTTKEVGKGTGLGLSICYGIVREHGGEILCQNNADGPGATFIVRLPSAIEAASTGKAVGVNQR